MNQFDHFLLERRGQVALVTINRPEKLNSMAMSFWPQLRDLLRILVEEGSCRAVVITGAGGRAFSTGGDISGFGALQGVAERRQFMVECMTTFAAVEDCSLPVIAAVNGWALGGGCELTFACDIVLAAESAVFGMPEAKVGLVPGFGVLRAPSVIGRQWTKFLVFSGETIDARQAERIGIAQHVVADADLLETAMALAGKIAAQAPLALRVGKRVINRDVNQGESGYSVEAITMLHSTEDAAEGVRAFEARRPPVFEGR